MTTFATREHSREPGDIAGIVVRRRSSRRDTFEAIGLLLGVLIILLALALTVGATLPIGP